MNAIFENERLDAVNDRLSLITDKNGLTLGTDALLLASFIRGNEKLAAVELGAGTGILSMLLAVRKKAGKITALEVQEKYAALSKRNVALNELTDKIEVIHTDIRTYPVGETVGKFDIAFSNPPYLKADGGFRNKTDDNYIARHEVFGGIEDFAYAASRLLRYGGRFYLVHRPERLADIFDALRKAHLEPKRLVPVLPSPEEAPSLVLVEAVSGAKPSLVFSPSFPIYTDKTHTEESRLMKALYESGNLDTEETQNE